MSGGQALAQCLSRALSAPCIGREILVEAAARLGVTQSLLREKIETSPGFFERFSSERGTYVLAVQAALAAHAASGHLVYHGQAGHLLLRGLPCVLRVRLIAPLDKRVRAVVDERRVSPDEAMAHIRRLDGERARWTRAMYGVDVADSALYDLVINLENITSSTACAAILGVLARPEYQVDDEALSTIRAFAASCRAELEAHQSLRAASAAVRTRVLVVDGDAAAATALAEKLHGSKYATATASSPSAALRRAGTESFDVIVLDLDGEQGEGRGLELLREIRALDRHVQVLVTAGRGTVASAIEGMQIGAADFLQKPVELDVLCRAIDAAAQATRNNRSQGGSVEERQ